MKLKIFVSYNNMDELETKVNEWLDKMNGKIKVKRIRESVISQSSVWVAIYIWYTLKQ